jgi:hypothetical protein
MGFLFGCEKKKEGSKVTYSRDSLFQSLQHQENLKDTTYIDLGIGSVQRLDFDTDKLAFIHLDNYENPMSNMKQDLYILLQKDKKWQLIDSIKLDYEIHWIDTVQLMDIDFDGKDEILVKYPSLSGSRDIYPYEFLKYDKLAHKTEYFTAFTSSLGDKIIDIKNKTIVLGIDGGHDFQFKTVYAWHCDTLQDLRGIELHTIYDNDKPKTSITENYFKQGNLVKSKETFFRNAGKARAYFET